MYKGQGDKEHDTYTLVTEGDWATGRGRKGGERTHGQQMKAEVRRDPWKGKTLGDDRDLGAGQGRQRGGERTRNTEFTGMRRRTPGSGRDLGSISRKAREVNVGMRGEGRQVGVMSRWTDYPRPGESGGRSMCNIYRVERI